MYVAEGAEGAVSSTLGFLLVEVDPALAGRLAQQLGHLVPVGVGDAQL